MRHEARARTEASNVTVIERYEEGDFVGRLVLDVRCGPDLVGNGRFMYDLRTLRGFFTMIFVHPAHRLRGHATAVYDAVEDMGFLVEPSEVQTRDGYMFWEARNRRTERNAGVRRIELC